jgi:hypothetical protein
LHFRRRCVVHRVKMITAGPHLVNTNIKPKDYLAPGKRLANHRPCPMAPKGFATYSVLYVEK